ncbi:MAG: hypothetical protein J6N20_18385 [Pseudomonas sp.]|nr:hypothetical protein [Pseudomonas sp.]
MAIGLSQIQTIVLEIKAGTGFEKNRSGLIANAGNTSPLTHAAVQALRV